MSMNKPALSACIANEANNCDQFSNHNQIVDVENHRYQFRKNNEIANYGNNLRRHKSNRVNMISDTGHTGRVLPFNE